ncbi:MAG: hypothetical protein OJF60_003466 [Burkholderiaceae bacterium]|jgi:hypothetical protein|nr:MAG: hypothetical protein OJF60_003466 [Burkholderiaceae bacterium]
MAGLGAARTAIEDQLDHLKGQRAVRLYAHLKKEAHAMTPEDVEYEVYQLKNTVDELFPKVFRGGFIISLWSVFEACIKDLAEYVRRQKDIPFSLQDLRAGDFLEQTDKFFFRILALKAFPEKFVRTKLEELKSFRNALVHHDGATEELPMTLRSKTEMEYRRKGLLVYSDLHHQYAVPTAEYAEEAFNVVRTFLEKFAETVYIAIHPVALEDGA